jgi:hypothetical protein
MTVSLSPWQPAMQKELRLATLSPVLPVKRRSVKQSRLSDRLRRFAFHMCQ